MQVAHRVARPNFDDADQTATADKALEQATREARFLVAAPTRQTAVHGNRR